MIGSTSGAAVGAAVGATSGAEADTAAAGAAVLVTPEMAITGYNITQRIQGQIDTVVGHPALGKIVGADSLAAVS